jgi:hypothetical protein
MIPLAPNTGFAMDKKLLTPAAVRHNKVLKVHAVPEQLALWQETEDWKARPEIFGMALLCIGQAALGMTSTQSANKLGCNRSILQHRLRYWDKLMGLSNDYMLPMPARVHHSFNVGLLGTADIYTPAEWPIGRLTILQAQQLVYLWQGYTLEEAAKMSGRDRGKCNNSIQEARSNLGASGPSSLAITVIHFAGLQSAVEDLAKSPAPTRSYIKKS